MRTLTLYLSSKPHAWPVKAKIQIESGGYHGERMQSWARASHVPAEPADIIVPIAIEASDNNYPVMRVVKMAPNSPHRTMRVQLSQLKCAFEADFTPSEMTPFMTPRYATRLIIETDLQERLLP